jgi:hypothetical protein
VPSLTRGRVCHLQLLLALASLVSLRSESPGTRDHILLFQIRDSTNLEGQGPVFIFPRNRVAQLYPPGAGFPFCRLLRFAGIRWKYSNPPPGGVEAPLCPISPYISQEQDGPVIPPQVLGSLFVASYDLQGFGGSIRTRLQAG